MRGLECSKRTESIRNQKVSIFYIEVTLNFFCKGYMDLQKYRFSEFQFTAEHLHLKIVDLKKVTLKTVLPNRSLILADLLMIKNRYFGSILGLQKFTNTQGWIVFDEKNA